MSFSRFVVKQAVIHPDSIIQSEVSQKEKYKIYTNAYIWNLERWYWWVNFQGCNGEADVENKPMNKGRGEEGEGEMYGK